MRAGEQAGPQAAGPQQRLGHPGCRCLAVSPGEVNHRVGTLRVAEQADQGLDPVQGRLDGVLRPARDDLALDRTQRLVWVGRHDSPQVSALTLAAYWRRTMLLAGRGREGGQAGLDPGDLGLGGSQPVPGLGHHRGGCPLDE